MSRGVAAVWFLQTLKIVATDLVNDMSCLVCLLPSILLLLCLGAAGDLLPQWFCFCVAAMLEMPLLLGWFLLHLLQ